MRFSETGGVFACGKVGRRAPLPRTVWARKVLGDQMPVHLSDELDAKTATAFLMALGPFFARLRETYGRALLAPDWKLSCPAPY